MHISTHVYMNAATICKHSRVAVVEAGALNRQGSLTCTYIHKDAHTYIHTQTHTHTVY